MSLHEEETDILKAALGRTPECPSWEAMEASESRSHIDTCAHCGAELALLQMFNESSPRQSEQQPVAWIVRQLHRRSVMPAAAAPIRPTLSWWQRFFSFPMPVAAAGMLLVVVAAGTYVSRPGEPALKLLLVGNILRSEQLSVIAPAGELASVPTELSWRAAPGASQYEVRVMTVDRVVLWSARTPGTTISLPPDLGVAGRTLLWQVVARDAAGRQLGASATVRFRVVK